MFFCQRYFPSAPDFLRLPLTPDFQIVYPKKISHFLDTPDPPAPLLICLSATLPARHQVHLSPLSASCYLLPRLSFPNLSLKKIRFFWGYIYIYNRNKKCSPSLYQHNSGAAIHWWSRESTGFKPSRSHAGEKTRMQLLLPTRIFIRVQRELAPPPKKC